jgi:hypothetical protein
VAAVPTMVRPATPGAAAMLAARRANVAKAPPVSADPFAPIPDAQIQQIIGRYTRGLPVPMTGPQIQTSAQGMIDPIIAAVTKDIQGQASTATGNISANAEALAKALGAIDYGAPYKGAESDQAAVDAALQQSLSGGGSDLAAGLKAKLAAIDDPTVAAAGDALASRGTALGTTQLARGSASLSDLIARAAASNEYGLRQPTIARESGLQLIGGVNQKATQSIADEAAKLEEQLPGIVTSLRGESQSASNNRASLAAKLYESLTGQNLSRAVAEAGLGKAQNTLALDQSKLNAQTASKPNAALSRAYGYAVDQYGQPVGGRVRTLPGYTTDAHGNVIKTGKGPAAAKPLSGSQLEKINSLAHDLYNGVPPKVQFNTQTQKWMPVPGTGKQAATWPRAIEQLVNEGATAAQAVKILSAQGWQPGEGGRPQSAAQKGTAAAVKSGLGVPRSPFAPGSPLFGPGR